MLSTCMGLAWVLSDIPAKRKANKENRMIFMPIIKEQSKDKKVDYYTDQHIVLNFLFKLYLYAYIFVYSLYIIFKSIQ